MRLVFLSAALVVTSAGAASAQDAAAGEKVFAQFQLAGVRDGLIRLIALLAPLSAAQYAWIVFRRINTPQHTTV